MPLFSVVIPCYNKANVISVTINSVLEQNFDDFEVLIIDDGSTDNSVKVIQSFNDNRIKLIQQKNAGVSIARNLGIQEATGEWIAFLDADDWWHPNYLTKVAEMQLKHSSANIFATSYISLMDDNNWIPEKCNELNSVSHLEIIHNLPQASLKNKLFFTSSITFKRDFLMQFQPCFPPNENQGEDLDLWFRVAEKEPIHLYHSKLVVYRTEQGNSLASNQQLEVIPPFMGRLQKRAALLNDYAYLQSVTYYIQNALLFNSRKLFFKNNRIKAINLVLIARTPLNLKWLIYLISFCCLPKFIAKKILYK